MIILIDLFELAKWAGAISVVSALLLSIFKALKKTVLSRIEANEKRIIALEAWTKAQQTDIIDSMEEKLILLRGTRACLEALRDGHANGNVTTAIKEISDYIDKKAHRANSNGGH